MAPMASHQQPSTMVFHQCLLRLNQITEPLSNRIDQALEQIQKTTNALISSHVLLRMRT